MDLFGWMQANRHELVVLAICIIGIQVITGGGGFLKKGRAKSMTRIGDGDAPGEAPK